MDQPSVLSTDDFVEFIATDTGIARDLLSGDQPLRDVGVGSFVMMQLITLVEERYGVEFEPEELVAIFAMSAPAMCECVRGAMERNA